MKYWSIFIGTTLFSTLTFSQPTQRSTGMVRPIEIQRPVFSGNENEYHRKLFHFAQSFRTTQPDSLINYATFFSKIAEKNNSVISSHRHLYLSGLFWVYRNQPDSVNKYLFPLTKLPDTDSTVDLKTMSLNQLGLFYSRSANTTFYSLPFFMTLDSLFIEKQFQKDRFGNLMNLMNAHRRMGNFISALDDVQVVMNLDSVRWKHEAVFFMNTAEIYRMLKDDELAKTYLLMAMNIQTSPLPVKLSVKSSLAMTYLSLHQLDSATYYFRQIISTPLTPQTANLVISPLLEISKTFESNGPIDSIFYYLYRAEKIATDFKLNRELTVVLEVMAINYLKINQPSDALIKSRRALILAKQTNYTTRFGPIYDILSKAYEANSQPDSAIYYSRLTLDEKDKHIDLAYKNAEARSLVIYANRKEDSRLKSLKSEVSNSRYLMVILSIISAGIFIAIVLLFKRYQKNQEEVKKAKLELIQSLKKVKILEEKQSKGEQTWLLSNKTILKLSDIKYVEVDGHHLTYFVSFQKAPFIERNTLAELLEKLPEDEFIQIHRSIIVNRSWIQSYQSESVNLKTGEQLKISRTFKSNISKFVNN